MFLNTKTTDVLKLLEIYASAKDLQHFSHYTFPYATYSTLMKKYPYTLDRFDLISIIALVNIRSNSTNDSKSQYYVSNLIRKEAFELAKSFEIIDSNTNGDEMFGATGVFGYGITNPIPVYGFLGINDYFSKLRTLDGEPINYVRIGAFKTPNIKESIDAYKVTGSDIGTKTLFICVYNNRTSNKSPDGFRLI